MPELRDWVAKALKEDWARTYNQMLKLQYPSGQTTFLISPDLTTAYWLVYGWNYGQMLDPNGVQHYSEKFKFIWEQSGIKRFEDYMVPSMMDFTYPVFLIVTEDDPVYTEAVNNTGETQTVDFTAFLILFEKEEFFEKWSEWFDKKYSVSPWKVWAEGLTPEQALEVLG